MLCENHLICLLKIIIKNLIYSLKHFFLCYILLIELKGIFISRNRLKTDKELIFHLFLMFIRTDKDDKIKELIVINLFKLY